VEFEEVTYSDAECFIIERYGERY